MYARWKATRCSPIDEDQLIYHLSEMGKPILCGIDKHHIGLYEYGNDDLQVLGGNELYICKNCLRIYKIRAFLMER